MCKTGIMYQSGCDICYVFLTPHRSVELGLRSAYLREEVQRNRDIRTGVKEKQMYGNRKSDKEWRKKLQEQEGGKRNCCTYWTAVEMCRRRMPGVGNWREFM